MLDKNAYQLQIQDYSDTQLFQETKKRIIAANRDTTYEHQSIVDLCYKECLRRKKLQIYSRAQRAASYLGSD